MNKKLLHWILCCCLLTMVAGTVGLSLPRQSGHVYTWDENKILRDGDKIGSYWRCIWLGLGSGQVSSGQLWLSPMVSTSPGETHSGLIGSNFSLGRTFDISVDVTTDQQLRITKTRKKTISTPNPWEVAWLIANMADDGSAGVYFIYKPNGVELGAYGEFGRARTYLYTAGQPTLVLGRRYTYRLMSNGESLIAAINGVEVASASLSSLTGYSFGNKIGLYTEDASVHFGPVTCISYP